MHNEAKYLHYAKKIKIFNGLSPKEVSDILHEGHTLEFFAGQSVFHKGQLGGNLFVVLNGTVDIENEGMIIAKCRPGDAFGEMSVLNHRPHCASANAYTDVKLFTLDEDQINRLLEKKGAVRLLLNVIHMMSSHLEKANTIIATQNKLHPIRDAEGDGG